VPHPGIGEALVESEPFVDVSAHLATFADHSHYFATVAGSPVVVVPLMGGPVVVSQRFRVGRGWLGANLFVMTAQARDVIPVLEVVARETGADALISSVFGWCGRGMTVIEAGSDPVTNLVYCPSGSSYHPPDPRIGEALRSHGDRVGCCVEVVLNSTSCDHLREFLPRLAQVVACCPGVVAVDAGAYRGALGTVHLPLSPSSP
jgi:formylmethanofuran:tetrahydromethanopterin formyltransferase